MFKSEWKSGCLCSAWCFTVVVENVGDVLGLDLYELPAERRLRRHEPCELL